MEVTDCILMGFVLAVLLLSVAKGKRRAKKALVIGARQFWNVLPFFVAVFRLMGCSRCC